MASFITPPKPGKVKKPSSPNHRASVRYRCPPATPGRVYLPEDLEFQRAWLLDLSENGVGLLMSKLVDPGLFLTINLKSPVSNKAYRLEAHVVHVTQQSGGDWVVGCQFVTKLQADELDDLL